MAVLRYCRRRARQIIFYTPAQVLSIFICLFFAIRWVSKHSFFPDDASSPTPPIPTARIKSVLIDWSGYKYVQFATSPDSLCNSLLIWESFEQFDSLAKGVMYYPSNWDGLPADNDKTHVVELLDKARKDYHVDLRPLDTLNFETAEQEIWTGDNTKFLAFNQTDLKRVVIIDPASHVRKNVDELFLLPSLPIALPYVYFGEKARWQFSSQLMLLTPSAESFSRIANYIQNSKGAEAEHFDETKMLTTLFHGQILKLPQRVFALRSSEFRKQSHFEYLMGGGRRFWDAARIIKETKIIHFSDSPLPKPWEMPWQKVKNAYMPPCKRTEWFGMTDCRDRTEWLRIYAEYARQRPWVCGTAFEIVSPDGPEDMGSGRDWLFDLD